MSNITPGQIDYTSRDYASIRYDLLQLIRNRTGLEWNADDPSDIGVVLLESFAYMGDILNYYIDRAANESFIDTATRKSTLLNLSSLFGYRPSGPTPASVYVTFTNTSSSPVDLPAGTQVVSPLQYGDYTEVFFETTQAVTQLAADASISVACLEGKTANSDIPSLIDPATNLPLPVSLGVSTGTASTSVKLPDLGVVDGSVKAYVGQGESFTEWTWVDSLIEWGPSDQVFTTQINTDYSVSLLFGDGVNGAIPPSQQLISASYKVSLGAAGNISAGQIAEVTFIPGLSNPNAGAFLEVNNELAAVGGADADSSSQIRTKLRSAVSARRRAVTLNDYENLALLVPQVGLAKAVSDVYTSVSLYVQSQNDGTKTPGIDEGTGDPTATLEAILDSVQEYMADKIPANSTITVSPPEYVDLDIKLVIGVGSAYKPDVVKTAVVKKLLDPSTGLYSYGKYGFGSVVAMSDLIVAAATTDGVISVTVEKLARHGLTTATDVELAAYELPVVSSNNLEIETVGGLL